jgi:hypothetical protein
MLQQTKNGIVVKTITDPAGSNVFRGCGGVGEGEIRQRDANATVGGRQMAFDLPAWWIKRCAQISKSRSFLLAMNRLVV